MDIWMCQGIGLDNEALFPLLDPLKIARYMESELKVDFEEDLQPGSDFLKLSTKEQLDVLVEYCDDYPDGIMEILAHADPNHILTGMNDNNGRYFLLYPPRYSWQQTGEMFKGPEDVWEYVCKIVMPFTKDGTKRELVFDLVKEFDEFACD